MNNFSSDNSLEENDEIEPISKSQIKREMLALQDLGEKLCKLPLKVIKDFGLNETLFAAYEAAQSIHSHSAQKRHRQYVGKILRKIPSEEVDRINKQLNDYENGLHQETKQFHHLEQLRDNILGNGDKAINELLLEYPFMERSYLRQLVRNANKEREKQQAPKSARLLFKYLKEHVDEN